MDTLVIVRKIREAEALADAGKHGDARRLLEPLLSQDGLTDNHRKLVGKKIDLFKKQHERMTRIISRRATGVSNDEANQSSERTAIRKPLKHDRSERPTDHTPDKEDATERPTNRTIETQAHGAPTEVVPRAHHVDTEVPQGHKLKVQKSPRQSSGSWNTVSDRREVVRPSDPSDSQELAPVMDNDPLQSIGEATDDDPRATDIFVVPPEPVKTQDSRVQPEAGGWPASVSDKPPDDDSSPSIGRYSMNKSTFSTGNDTPAAGWNDTPVPSAVTPRPPVRVSDSFVIPGSDTVMSPALPPRDDEDSTYLLADDYFNSRPSARQRERSNPELKALADRLPDDDLRRELALEVVKLREELENAKSGRTEASSREAPRSGSRKIQREERPESGSFHIPASQVNTIVRRAAGTDQIEVHMPTRDEDAADLQVLRRDSVRGAKVNATPTDRIALAQDYIEAGQITKPGLLKPVATWLGVLVVLGVIAWAVHLAYQSIARTDQLVDVTEQQAGPYRLNTPKGDYPEIANREDLQAAAITNKRGWLVQYDPESKLLTAISVPGPAMADPADTGFSDLRVSFNGDEYPLAQGATLDQLKDHFGKPTPAFSEAVWDSAKTYTLRFANDRATLEFCFNTSDKSAPLWMRLVTGKSPPAAPTRASFD